MKSVKGLARIPVIITLLVLAAGGASFHSKLPVLAEEPAVVIESPAPEGDVAFLGEMTVTASRTRG